MNIPSLANRYICDVPVYEPGRPIEEVARELRLNPKTIIKLASNENALGPSPKAVAAMRQALATAHLYPDGGGFYLRQALAKKLNGGGRAEARPSEVKIDNIILGTGSNEIIEFLYHAFVGPGDEIVAGDRAFVIYSIMARMFQARCIEVPFRGHTHDLKAMLTAITPKTKLVFVANPNNPTGTRVANAELDEFIRALPAHVMAVLDEAYIEFLDEPLDLLPVVRNGGKPNLLLMRTFSKIYGLAGLRIGYGIGHPDFIAALEKIRQPFNINLVAQAGALAALDDTKHIEKTRKINSRGLRLYARTFRKLGLEFIPSQANFIMVRVGDGQRVFGELQKLGVIVRPMGGYQLPEWVRISIGTPKENKRCLEALKKVL